MASKIRTATKADIRAFYGHLLDAPARSIALEMDGEVVMIAGVMHGYPLVAFMDMSDRLRKSPRELIKVIPNYQELLSKYDRPILAKASDEESNAPRFLMRVGFEKVEELEGFYRWQHR